MFLFIIGYIKNKVLQKTEDIEKIVISLPSIDAQLQIIRQLDCITSLISKKKRMDIESPKVMIEIFPEIYMEVEDKNVWFKWFNLSFNKEKE